VAIPYELGHHINAGGSWSMCSVDLDAAQKWKLKGVPSPRLRFSAFYNPSSLTFESPPPTTRRQMDWLSVLAVQTIKR